ncbi:MAG TPA: biotin transporter BioY [bacterium]|nr:biotin transporter BioY [bacterium]
MRFNVRKDAVAIARIREFDFQDALFAAQSVLAFTGLMILGAKMRVLLPFSPVPFTMQVFFALLAGVLLGPGMAAASQALYLALGAAGIPVFSGSVAGLAYLMGPTGGYLISFLFVPQIVARILGRGVTINGKTEINRVRMILALAVGVAVIHLMGILHLCTLTGGRLMTAFIMGLPFIPADVVKAIAVAWITPRLMKR